VIAHRDSKLPLNFCPACCHVRDVLRAGCGEVPLVWGEQGGEGWEKRWRFRQWDEQGGEGWDKRWRFRQWGGRKWEMGAVFDVSAKFPCHEWSVLGQGLQCSPPLLWIGAELLLQGQDSEWSRRPYDFSWREISEVAQRRQRPPEVSDLSGMKGLTCAVLLGSVAEEPQGRMRRPQSVHKAANYMIIANTTHFHPREVAFIKKNQQKPAGFSPPRVLHSLM